MKYSLQIAICVAGMAATTCLAVNLVPNGDFASWTGNVPDAWIIEGYLAPPDGSVVQETVDVFDGNPAAKVRFGGGDSSWAAELLTQSDLIPIDPNKYYVFSAAFKPLYNDVVQPQPQTSWDQLYVRVGYVHKDTGGMGIWGPILEFNYTIPDQSSPQIAWHELSKTFKTVVDPNYLQVRIYVFSTWNTYGILDKVSLAKWEPSDCNQVWAKGYGIEADLNTDCKVDMKDVRMYAEKWLQCYVPGDSTCQKTWPAQTPGAFDGSMFSNGTAIYTFDGTNTTFRGWGAYAVDNFLDMGDGQRVAFNGGTAFQNWDGSTVSSVAWASNPPTTVAYLSPGKVAYHAGTEIRVYDGSSFSPIVWATSAPDKFVSMGNGKICLAAGTELRTFDGTTISPQYWAAYAPTRIVSMGDGRVALHGGTAMQTFDGSVVTPIIWAGSTPSNFVSMGDGRIAYNEGTALYTYDGTSKSAVTWASANPDNFISMGDGRVALSVGNQIGYYNGSSISGAITAPVAMDSGKGFGLGDGRVVFVSGTDHYVYDGITLSAAISNTYLSNGTHFTAAVGGSEPQNCVAVWEGGYGISADLDQNCRVNLADFAKLAEDWMRCNVPTAGLCEKPWQ